MIEIFVNEASTTLAHLAEYHPVAPQSRADGYVYFSESVFSWSQSMLRLITIYGICGILGLFGVMQAEACTRNLAIPETTPTSDFVLSADGTARHVPTGLIWKRCAEGQAWESGGCSGSPEEFNWQSALQQSNTVNTSGGFAGQSDWRLPDIKELQSIVEQQCYGPALNPVVFPNQSTSTFWSSSPSAYGSDGAWVVNFNNGHALPIILFGDGTSLNIRSDSRYARLVRSGQ